ncbi:MAG: hypothetical protein LBU50_03080 [Cellulomonas sp.]|nr:hypothetical protein [Cellulomonas sp.]
MDSLDDLAPVRPVSADWDGAWPKVDVPDDLPPDDLAPDGPAPNDPIPSTWPKDWRKAVEAFRASRPDVFTWSCDWHGSARTFRKTCRQVLAVLELRHGLVRNVDWVLIPVRGDLWPGFLEEFRVLPPDRQARIASNLARHNRELAASLTDRRVQEALERLGGQTVWNTLEPFDRRLSFVALMDQNRLIPDMLRAEFVGGRIVDVAFRRPGGCRVSVVNEGGRGSWSTSDVLYERQVADAEALDAAILEVAALLEGR